MASKYRLEDSFIYLAGSDVPYNKLEITDSEELHEVERELLEEAYQIFAAELDDTTLFDEAYFKALHQRTFECLYDWAGKYRDFNMMNGNSHFCQGDYVESSSCQLFAELAELDYLQGASRSKAEFVQKLAYFKGELIALHPFCELNGRITRLFFDMLVRYHGYQYIDYSGVSPDDYIQAAIACVQFADCAAMERIIAGGLK